MATADEKVWAVRTKSPYDSLPWFRGAGFVMPYTADPKQALPMTRTEADAFITGVAFDGKSHMVVRHALHPQVCPQCGFDDVRPEDGRHDWMKCGQHLHDLLQAERAKTSALMKALTPVSRWFGWSRDVSSDNIDELVNTVLLALKGPRADNTETWCQRAYQAEAALSSLMADLGKIRTAMNSQEAAIRPAGGQHPLQVLARLSPSLGQVDLRAPRDVEEA